MAFDFHLTDNNQHLFSIKEKEYRLLADIFEKYFHYTGANIDLYSDGKLNQGNLQTLIKVIDNYTDTTNLNQDKFKTITILGFRGKLQLCIDNQWDLTFLGD